MHSVKIYISAKIALIFPCDCISPSCSPQSCGNLVLNWNCNSLLHWVLAQLCSRGGSPHWRLCLWLKYKWQHMVADSNSWIVNYWPYFSTTKQHCTMMASYFSAPNNNNIYFLSLFFPISIDEGRHCRVWIVNILRVLGLDLNWTE